ncbi:YdcH family protein [Thalassotalea profundi]|uniref:GTP-binding protein n=1 Tax=Thalassotalea profundi TaxID=2036687 RepID=A0ABQ3IWU6_9GAMM|nr:YdcH family protein [Thalassotalea profundi]GHE97248.1 GTP-binding protein [Thalassotalea profundi]
MSIEKHDLHNEFPEFEKEIHDLKISDGHFARLFKEYHEVDHEIHRIEQGVENTTDEYLELQKKQRLNLKDQLFAMLKKTKATA